jgi:hypothetical protein
MNIIIKFIHPHNKLYKSASRWQHGAGMDCISTDSCKMYNVRDRKYSNWLPHRPRTTFVWCSIWLPLRYSLTMENKYTYEHYTKFPNVNVSLTKQNKTKNFEKCCKEQHVLNRQRIVISEQYSSYYLPISVGFYCTADIICFTSIFRGSHGPFLFFSF